MISVSSPNGLVLLTVALDSLGGPTVAVRFRERAMLQASRLGLTLMDGSSLRTGFQMSGGDERSEDVTWRPAYGERAELRNRYREVTVHLQPKGPSGRGFGIVLRCYDEGVAWRYVLPSDGASACEGVSAEHTELRFPEGTDGYFEAHTEGEYVRTPVGAFPQACELPLTLVYAHGKLGCFLEACNIDWPKLRVGSLDGALVSLLDGPASAPSSDASPWRVLLVADRPADLALRSDLVLNLSAPCALADTAWIRPGKALREVTLSTAGGRACVDFAAAQGLQYVHYDAGWYGHEYDEAADARTVSPDPERVAKVPGWSGLNLPEVVDYARSKGIGVWLYVNRRALERQADELLPLYASWGIVGIKAGFVNVGPQTWTVWVHELVRKAARYRLMVDIHDAYRPSGFTRTYPNLLTQEGVRGNEHMPTARHNCTLPFTRAPAGAYDCTYCYFDARLKSTHSHQLALAVVFYSPLGFFFWYDRPQASCGEPELSFWRNVPTTWDETRVLAGEIGEFALVARRSGSVWFVGMITNEYAREPTLSFGYLEAGRSYHLELYRDAFPGESGGRTGVVVERGILNSRSTLRVALAASGGCALRLVPA